MTIQSPTPNDRGRRGMLLLLVLNVLALFLVVGALGIVVATRARDSARAFAAAQANQVNSPALARGLLDEALLTLIRGPSANGVTESLLEDKYGSPSLAGSLTAISASGPIVTATITGISTTNPATLNGRIVTLVPTGTDSTGPTSWRILRVDQGTTTYRLANVRPQTPAQLPIVSSGTPCEVIINGREFDGTGNDEPYDAFDTNNPFLTQPVLASSTVSSVARPAFGSAGQTCTVDNDGDGVADGIWLNDVLPSMRSPNGGQLTFSVSYLVLDLDGRINLNAHGSVARAQTVLSSTTYPARPTSFATASTWAISGTIPLGMGYGPADIDASLLVALQPDVVAGAIPPRYVTLLQGGTVTQNSVVSSAAQWRPTPRAGTTQLGRYGGSVGPGNSTSTTGTMAANADYWMLNPTGNSPTDLKARLQVFTEGSPPSLKFARPAPSWAVGDTDDIVGSGTTAHPYAMRLDEDAPRAAGGNATEAVYTVAELERILRPYDSDAAQLAPRLAAILDDYAEPSRMTVTTDSWDTPAIVGSLAQTIVAGGTTGHSPDVMAGLRFNLNRPLVSGSARQDYFNQLRKLCETVNVPTAEAAQWAANVIEFRDPDSIITWFPYGSGTTGVWGMERPEVVITDATFNAMTGELTVNLYRPWSAQLCSGSSATATGTTEAIDNSLGNRVANTLTLTGNSGTNAVWQFVVSGTTSGTFVGGPVGLGSLISTATAVQTNTAVGPATIALTGTPAQVMLQRLANPAAPRDTNANNSTYNDYVTVHRVSVPQGSRSLSRWLHWPNRDFVSHGELLTVLSGTVADVPEVMFSGSETALVRQYPDILEATIVPSRFAGANVSVNNGATALAGTGYENFQYGQLSRWREPGKVNVNTILPNVGNSTSTLDNAVWNALVGGTSVPNPVTSGSYLPVQSLRTLLTGSTATTPGPFDRPSTDANARSAFLQRATAIRLANCATTRSHVFAVWITLRITDSSPNAGPPQFARLFAIVDRSIPVGYSPGRNLNVRETIRLQRFVE